MNNKKSLIVWNDCWADEFDIFGFDIVKQSDLDYVLKGLAAIRKLDENLYFRTQEWGFRTNEYMEYSFSDMDEIISNSVELDNTDYHTLEYLFGSSKRHGQVFFDQLYDMVAESLDELKYE